MTGVRKGEVAVIITDGQAAVLEAMLIEVIRRKFFPGVRNRTVLAILMRLEMATASAAMDKDKD